MILSEIKDIRGRLTTNTELARVVDQINKDVIKKIQDNNVTVEDNINTILPYLRTSDAIVNSAVVTKVNSDHDLVYDKLSNIVTWRTK